MTVCPTCRYRWESHDDAAARTCYSKWQLVLREVVSQPQLHHIDLSREARLRGGMGSPSWRRPYLEPRAVAA